MSRSVFLTTTGLIGTTTIDDLGGVEYIHPVVSLDLVAPNGEFSYDEVINSTDTDTPTSSLQAAVNAGYITLSDATGNPITDLGAFTINVATETEEGIVSITSQTFGGQKSFATGLDVNGTVDYELTIAGLDDAIPNVKYVDDSINNSGASLQFQWRFSTSLVGDPGNGKIAYNNTDPALVTEIRLSDETDSGANIDYILASLEVGDSIYWQSSGNSLAFILVSINGTPIDNTTYWSFPVTVEDSGVLPNNNAKGGGILIFSSSSVVNLGTNVTGTTVEITNTAGDDATLQGATATDAGLVTNTAQTFAGRKTFNDNKILIDPLDVGAGTTLEIGWFDDLSPNDPNSFGVRRTDGGGVFSWLSNADTPQIFFGSATSTGETFLDSTNNRPLNLNVLDTGPDDPGTVTVGIGGFVVAGSSGITNVNPMEVNRGSGGGEILSFVVENDGTITAGSTTTYESLVLADNDIPNKKYVDDAIAAIPTGGGGTGFIEYKFDNSTSMSDPGNGEFRYNNSNPSLVTSIAISDESEQGGDISTLIGFLAVGDVVYIQEVEDGGAFGIFQISSTVDNGSWWQLNVSVLDSGTLPDDGKECGVNFIYGGISNSTTDDLPEGTTNLYYTEARVSANPSVVANTAKVSADGSIDTHSDVDLTTVPPTSGDLLFYDGSDFRVSDGVSNSVKLFENGCALEVIDSTGLDFCNTQIGAVSGSAFYIAKRGLGTIASPTPITNGTKIGGYSFLGVDGLTSNPGYVSAEMSSTAQEDFGANAGANLLFEVTEVGTKVKIPALEIEDDGTLSVAGQTDYELKVTEDDDVPNAKWVLDLLNNGDQPVISYNRTTLFNITAAGVPEYVPFPNQLIENNTDVLEKDGVDDTRFNIKETGLYAIAQNLIHDASGGNIVTSRIILNGTTTISGTEFSTNPPNNGAAVTPWNPVSLTSGDFIQLEVEVNALVGEIRANSGLAIVRLAAPKGEKGDTGSGSSITLQQQDVTVPGGPHDTVNFADNFVVTNNGSGKATVSLPIVGSFIRVFSDGAGDNTVNYNNVAPTIVQLSGGTEGIGTDFTFDGANDWVVCNFDGWVRASYMFPQFCPGTRAGFRTRLVLENVAGSSQDERAFDYNNMRTGTDIDYWTAKGTTFYPVANGEKIYIWVERGPGATSTTSMNISDIAELMVERLA